MEHCHSEAAVWGIQIITFCMGIYIGYRVSKKD